ncbi:hypothetical protein [Haloarcula sp. H-GB5]
MMGKKRRKNKEHKIGESMPGTVGDSKGTYHDDASSPMANVHNRRNGELISGREADRYLNPEKYKSENPSSGETNPSDCEYGFPLTKREKSAVKYGHYWTPEQKREFLNSDTELTVDDLGWEDLDLPSKETEDD